MSLFPKTYSRYVNFIKLTLLIGIVLAFGFTFGWPYIMSLGKEDMVLVDASRPEIQENRMVHPHYVSTDETDQPFHVDADWAKQTTEGIADLTNPSGAITVENKVIEGDLSIEGEGPAGKIYGQNGFKIENRSEGKKVITLKGPSRIEINRGSLKKKKG